MFKSVRWIALAALVAAPACGGTSDSDRPDSDEDSLSGDDESSQDDGSNEDATDEGASDESSTEEAPTDETDTSADPDAALTEAMDAARLTYAEIVSASYQDSLGAATALDSALREFTADPTEDTLDAARSAWLAAREPYLQTEVFRFYDGPIDNPEDGPEGSINAWPLDESYIDYVEGDDSAGIINDPERTISAEELLALNEQGGTQNIATGYHAIEFLLWGQDQSDTGPGARPASDYLADGSGTAANQDRRAEYLETVSQLLVDQVEQLTLAWAADEDNYRASFEAEDPEEALRRILTGMIILSGFETGGERLQAALDTGEQEDEHSCFSDNTHRDMVQDIQGVWNVWTGTYEGNDIAGSGVRDVVEVIDADLAATLDEKIEESLSLAQALQPPFDQEIATDNDAGRERVQALIDALRSQEESLQEVFRGLGLSIPEPP